MHAELCMVRVPREHPFLLNDVVARGATRPDKSLLELRSLGAGEKICWEHKNLRCP